MYFPSQSEKIKKNTVKKKIDKSKVKKTRNFGFKVLLKNSRKD